ncbi:MAG: hypothetical protein R3E31_16305 [Chloroflexota bacterium]
MLDIVTFQWQWQRCYLCVSLVPRQDVAERQSCRGMIYKRDFVTSWRGAACWGLLITFVGIANLFAAITYFIS